MSASIWLTSGYTFLTGPCPAWKGEKAKPWMRSGHAGSVSGELYSAQAMIVMAVMAMAMMKLDLCMALHAGLCRLAGVCPAVTELFCSGRHMLSLLFFVLCVRPPGYLQVRRQDRHTGYTTIILLSPRRKPGCQQPPC